MANHVTHTQPTIKLRTNIIYHMHMECGVLCMCLVALYQMGKICILNNGIRYKLWTQECEWVSEWKQQTHLYVHSVHCSCVTGLHYQKWDDAHTHSLTHTGSRISKMAKVFGNWISLSFSSFCFIRSGIMRPKRSTHTQKWQNPRSKKRCHTSEIVQIAALHVSAFPTSQKKEVALAQFCSVSLRLFIISLKLTLNPLNCDGKTVELSLILFIICEQ